MVATAVGAVSPMVMAPCREDGILFIIGGVVLAGVGSVKKGTKPKQ